MPEFLNIVVSLILGIGFAFTIFIGRFGDNDDGKENPRFPKKQTSNSHEF